MRTVPCPRCGQRSHYLFNSHELYEYEVCIDCSYELNEELDKIEEEKEKRKEEEEEEILDERG